MRMAGGWRIARGCALIAALAAGAGSATPIMADSAPALVDQANRLYKEGRLAEALALYRKAGALAPGSAAIHYNIGNALYRQGEFDKAYDEYRQAFASPDRSLAEGARYNAGNAHFARKNWQDAIRNYQDALRMNPSDMDAKRNLELALLQMQEEKKQQQQQQNQDQKQDDKQDQQNPQQNQQQPQEQKQSPQDAPKPQPREQKTPGSEKDRISRDEAMRILDAMKEQDRPPKDQIKAPPPDRRPEKDW